MKDDKLEVGDELYYTSKPGEMYYEGKIDRVTKTLAFIGDRKYRINLAGFGNGCTEHPGEFSFGARLYYLLDDEKKQELGKQQKRRKLENKVGEFFKSPYAAVKVLSDSQLWRIIEILEEESHAE